VEQIVLGVIGSGGRGTFVMNVFQKHGDVKVASICDVYEPNLEHAISEAVKGGSHPRACRNYKDLLADKDIQAVLIATPEHWHYQMVTDAIAAGKDIYVEKPLCRTPEEGVRLVAAERASKCIVQVGMQRRSYDLYLAAREVVALGTLGRVRMVRSWWLNNSLSSIAANDALPRDEKVLSPGRPATVGEVFNRLSCQGPPVSSEGIVSWRDFILACRQISVAHERNNPGVLPQPFDVVIQSAESFSCLLLEMWMSEMYTRFRRLAPSFARSRTMRMTERRWRPSPWVGIPELLSEPSGCGSISNVWQNALGRGKLPELGGFSMELFLVFLLLRESVDIKRFAGDEDFVWSPREPACPAIATRHWYHTACAET
jgi:hypothetical protein